LKIVLISNVSSFNVNKVKLNVKSYKIDIDASKEIMKTPMRKKGSSIQKFPPNQKALTNVKLTIINNRKMMTRRSVCQLSLDFTISHWICTNLQFF